MRQHSTYTRSEEQDGRGAGLSATPGERLLVETPDGSRCDRDMPGYQSGF